MGIVEPSKCKTINLAQPAYKPKKHADYDNCDKCPFKCRTPGPVQPGCPAVKANAIRVCTKDDLLISKCKKIPPKVAPCPEPSKTLFVVKCIVWLSAVSWTFREGVWGDQQETNRCARRWAAYVNAINSREPPCITPVRDVMPKANYDPNNTLFNTIFLGYKSLVVACFTGVATLPKVAMCTYREWTDKKEADKAAPQK